MFGIGVGICTAIKKRITPVRDGNWKKLLFIQTVQKIKKRITPVRDGNAINTDLLCEYIHN